MQYYLMIFSSNLITGCHRYLERSPLPSLKSALPLLNPAKGSPVLHLNLTLDSFKPLTDSLGSNKLKDKLPRV